MQEPILWAACSGLKGDMWGYIQLGHVGFRMQGMGP